MAQKMKKASKPAVVKRTPKKSAAAAPVEAEQVEEPTSPVANADAELSAADLEVISSAIRAGAGDESVETSRLGLTAEERAWIQALPMNSAAEVAFRKALQGQETFSTAARAHIEDLWKDVEMLEDDLSKANTSLEEAQRALEEAKAQREGLDATFKETKEALEEAKAALEALKPQVDVLSRQVQALQDAAQQSLALDGRVQALSEELVSVSEEFVTERAQRERVEARLQQALADNQALARAASDWVAEDAHGGGNGAPRNDGVVPDYRPKSHQWAPSPTDPQGWVCSACGVADTDGRAAIACGAEATGTLCEACNLPQYRTPHGETCKNGHGGAQGAECEHVGARALAPFDAAAAALVASDEVRRRWPRYHGPCPDCGVILTQYASREHYVAGDW